VDAGLQQLLGRTERFTGGVTMSDSDVPAFPRPIAGFGKGFAPSATEAAKALGTPVIQDRHPPGVEGTNYSLNEMSKYIRDGRNDPRLRAFAGKVLIAAGKPKTVKGQAQAILNEIRKRTVYVQDPVNTELMATPARTLCLDEHGLCMPAADCDDRCIAFASAMLSIGIETRIVGQAYGTSQATHVICAVLGDNGNWMKVDPSSEKYGVDESYPATKEWWVDPISGTMSSTPNGAPTTMGKEPDHGDFIGVGAVPVQTEPAAQPTGVGVFPMAHAFAPQADSASYVPVGLERGLPCFPDGTPVKEAKDYAFSQQMVRGVGKVPGPRRI
jgi:hypothetical protein